MYPMRDVRNSFDQMVSRSYAFKPEAYNGSRRWQALKTLYIKNFLEVPATPAHIPKIIHQIWLGGMVPDKYFDYMASWQKLHPKWQYKLWTDEDVPHIKITRRDLYERATNLGMKSDILRYEILNQYGGLYVDTDFECLRPLDDLMGLDFFTAVGYDTDVQLYIGLIASIPNCTILKNVIRDMGKGELYAGNIPSKIMNTTGANVFTEAFFKSVGAYTEKVVAFPTPFFYPFPNNLRRELVNPYCWVQPFSYAIHHWAVSWVNKKPKQ